MRRQTNKNAKSIKTLKTENEELVCRLVLSVGNTILTNRIIARTTNINIRMYE